VTLQAKRAHIGQIAFAPAFGHRDDVIGIPESFSSLKSPLGVCFRACRSAKPLDVPQLRNAVEAAYCADAAVAFEDTFAEVARVAAQSPFFDAPIRTERQAAQRHFQIAPAAEASAVWSLREVVAIGASSLHNALRAH
jgi:hypothetical protein